MDSPFISSDPFSLEDYDYLANPSEFCELNPDDFFDDAHEDLLDSLENHDHYGELVSQNRVDDVSCVPRPQDEDAERFNHSMDVIMNHQIDESHHAEREAVLSNKVQNASTLLPMQGVHAAAQEILQERASMHAMSQDGHHVSPRRADSPMSITSSTSTSSSTTSPTHASETTSPASTASQEPPPPKKRVRDEYDDFSDDSNRNSTKRKDPDYSFVIDEWEEAKRLVVDCETKKQREKRLKQSKSRVDTYYRSLELKSKSILTTAEKNELKKCRNQLAAHRSRKAQDEKVQYLKDEVTRLKSELSKALSRANTLEFENSSLKIEIRDLKTRVQSNDTLNMFDASGRSYASVGLVLVLLLFGGLVCSLSGSRKFFFPSSQSPQPSSSLVPSFSNALIPSIPESGGSQGVNFYLPSGPGHFDLSTLYSNVVHSNSNEDPFVVLSTPMLTSKLMRKCGDKQFHDYQWDMCTKQFLAEYGLVGDSWNTLSTSESSPSSSSTATSIPTIDSLQDKDMPDHVASLPSTLSWDKEKIPQQFPAFDAPTESRPVKLPHNLSIVLPFETDDDGLHHALLLKVREAVVEKVLFHQQNSIQL